MLQSSKTDTALQIWSHRCWTGGMHQLPQPVGNTCWKLCEQFSVLHGELLLYVHLVHKDHEVFFIEVLFSQPEGAHPGAGLCIFLGWTSWDSISSFLQPAVLKTAILFLPSPSSIFLIRNLNIIGLGINPWRMLLMFTG